MLEALTIRQRPASAASRLCWALPLGAAREPRSFVGVRNLVDLIGVLARRGRGIFHVADPEDLSVVDLFGYLGGRRRLMVSIPRVIMCRVAGMAGWYSLYQRLFESLQLDLNPRLADSSTLKPSQTMAN